jgi:hypothetical protein
MIKLQIASNIAQGIKLRIGANNVVMRVRKFVGAIDITNAIRTILLVGAA